MEATQAPFVIRLIEGDVTRAQASMLVLNHFNGLAPDGAAGAVDRVLGGAIGRRAANGSLNGRFGATHFLPAVNSPLAAGVVLMISLGEPERFSPRRLHEVGAAIVEAAATFRMRDAATILHAAGTAKVDPEEATRRLVTGILTALGTVPGAECLRELSIVERNPAVIPKIERGVMSAASPPRVHVYVERARIESPGGGAGSLPDAEGIVEQGVPNHLRIGITRAGTNLKVTVIGSDASDASEVTTYPADAATNVVQNLQDQVFAEADAEKRAKELCGIGFQLYESFLGWTRFGLPELIEKAPGGLVVLRLDEATVDLPWEILFSNECFLSHTRVLARQVEIGFPGRQSAFVPPHETLQALVVGDPLGDLQGARREAEAVAKRLRRAGAQVTSLIGHVAYKDVSAALDSTDFDLFHYAGHAAFDELSEGHSGLVLEGRRLTADDLSTRRYLPRLFFANACNSAQTGEGTYADPFQGAQPTRNLVSGLLAAGARAFVGSMWRVDDAAALTFADAFYKSIAGGSGQSDGRRFSIGQATQRARQAVIDKHGDGQYAWAGYALYGSPWKPAL